VHPRVDAAEHHRLVFAACREHGPGAQAQRRSGHTQYKTSAMAIAAGMERRRVAPCELARLTLRGTSNAL